ncbi:MAG TPA: small ribosomal subunit Rsm22 family protein [Kofleriaceae bacterium]|nr:small ribosomal subunit Rsm22 family protein [Kofleriaceae bacterium]
MSTDGAEAPARPGLELVEDALWRAAEATLPAPARSGATLTQAVIERSRRYTSDRDLLDEDLDGGAAAADLAARALFFAVADAAKVAVPLAELAGRGLLPARDPLRVLDLGAGAGAMTLGAAAYLAASGRPARLAVVAVDRDRPALALFERAARDLAGALDGRIDLELRGELLRDAALERGGYDLVVVGSVLNELDERGRTGLVERALTALADGGALVVIEPALRETSRDLHRLRDHVLAHQLAHVFAPCIRAVAPCPALARERDWCHEDRPLSLPPRANRIAQVTGLRDGGMKFAYLVLRAAADPLVEVAGRRAALRIVSDSKRLKGRRECTGCGEDGWVRLRLLSRHRDDHNRAFERARRGDVVVLDRTASAGELRDLDADEEVDRVVTTDPAG